MDEMVKTGAIEQGVTPPEDETKCASADQLEEHVCKRLADKAACCCRSDNAEALKAFRDGGCCRN
jgi:hypothetical protein